MIFQSDNTTSNFQAILALLSQERANNRCDNDGVFTNTVERGDQARHFTRLPDETAFLTQIGGVK